MKELQRLALERIKILLKETSDKTQGTMGELRRALTDKTQGAEEKETALNDSYAPDENGQKELYEAEKWVNALLQCVKD